VNDAGSDRDDFFDVSFRDVTVAGDHSNLAESVTNSFTRGDSLARQARRTQDRIVKTSVTIFCLAERPYAARTHHCRFLAQTGSAALPVAR
jgi:hypothetical protein